MQDELALALDAILEAAESGEVITKDWVYERHPESQARLLIGTLELAGVLRHIIPARAGRLGPVRILHELGRGGMGVVYLAEYTASSSSAVAPTRIAVKVLHPHLARQSAVLERFREEARIGQDLGHPNLACAREYVQWKGAERIEHCLLLQVVEGHTLASLVHRRSALGELLLREVATSASNALVALHARGIVHADVKPENLMLADDGRVVLMDLGVSVSSGHPSRHYFAGSARHAAPEQLRGAVGQDPKIDQYALGSTLRLLAGAAPDAPLPPRYSSSLADVVARLSAEDPDDRFPDMHAVREALERSQSGPIREHTRVRGVALAEAGALHGRRDEELRLERAALLARSGRGSVVAVTGEGGIGKSRLCADFLLRCSEEEARTARFSEGGPELGLDVLRSTLAASVLSRAEAADQGASIAVDWAGEQPLPEGTTPTDLANSVVAVFEACRDARATVVWLDDLHLADEGALALLTALARRIALLPLLLLVSGRDNGNAAWRETLGTGAQVEDVQLERLRDADMHSLLEDAVLPARLDGAALQAVIRAAEGHPYFALALVRSRQFWKRLTKDASGTWTLLGSTDGLVPERGLGEFLLAALHRLDPADAHLLELASCFTGSPTLEFLQLAGAHPATASDAGATGSRDLAELAEIREGAVFFRHSIVSDVIRGDIPGSRRRTHYAKLARALKMTEENRPAAYCELAIRGGLWEEALVGIDDALAELAASWQWDRTAQLGELATAQADSVPPRLLMSILKATTHALRTARRVPEWGRAAEAYLAAVVAHGDHRDQIDGRTSHASYLTHIGRLDEAADELSTAYRLTREHDDHRRRPLILRHWADLQSRRGLLPAQLRAAKRLLRYEQRIGSRTDEARARMWLAVSLAEQEHEREALHNHILAYRLTRSLNIDIPIVCLSLIASNNVFSGRIAVARARYERARRTAARVRDRRLEVIVNARLANALRLSGEHAQAERLLLAGVGSSEAIGDLLEQIYALSELGRLHLDEGDIAQSRHYIERALARAEQVPSVGWTAWLRLDLGLLELRVGEYEIASAHVDASMQAFTGLEKPYTIMENWMLWGESLMDAGYAEPARAAFGRARDALRLSGARRGGVSAAQFEVWEACLGGPAPSAALTLLARRGTDVAVQWRLRMLHGAWYATGQAGHLDQARADLRLFASRSVCGSYEKLTRRVPLYRCIHEGEPLPGLADCTAPSAS